MPPHSRADRENLDQPTDLHVIRAERSPLDLQTDAAAAVALGRLLPLLADPDLWRRVGDIPEPPPVVNLRD